MPVDFVKRDQTAHLADAALCYYASPVRVIKTCITCYTADVPFVRIVIENVA